MARKRYVINMITAEQTRVVRRSAVFAVPRLVSVPQEVELEPLIPVEPSLNLAAYSVFLENMLSRANNQG
jgi:hypothetical protein